MEYAHKFYREHPCSHVHWVDAASAEQFELSFKRIAETLHLRTSGTHLRVSQDTTQEVCYALKRDINSQWLLVVDGLSDESALQETGGSDDGLGKLLNLIPKPPHARVLVTTRSKALAMRLVNRRDQFVVDIPALKDDDAAFLLHGSLSSDASRAKTAASVSRMLGGSAGALWFAYRYHREVDKNCRWREYMERIQQPPPPPSTAATNPGTNALVLRAWQLLYEHLRDNYPETASLLRTIGILDVQCMPMVFFSKAELRDHVRRLVKYGMVEPTADQSVMRVAAIVRHCIQTYLKGAGEQELYLVEEEKVLSLMCDKFDGKDPDKAELLSPIVLAALKFQPTSREGKRLAATLLFRLAHRLVHVGRPQEAVKHLERCLDLRKQDPENTSKDLIQDTERAVEDARNQLSRPGAGMTHKSKPETGRASSPPPPAGRVRSG